jgi:hypothetical protein
MNLLSIFGARPEAVKTAPIRKGLEPHPKPNTKFTRLWRVYPPSVLPAVLVAEWRTDQTDFQET